MGNGTGSEVMPNIDRLREIVKWVEAEDAKPIEISQWEQRHYVLPLLGPEGKPILLWTPAEYGHVDCETTFCVAGKIAFDDGEDIRTMGSEGFVRHGAKALGLNLRQANALFHGGNSAARVRELAEEFVGKPL